MNVYVIYLGEYVCSDINKLSHKLWYDTIVLDGRIVLGSTMGEWKLLGGYVKFGVTCQIIAW